MDVNNRVRPAPNYPRRIAYRQSFAKVSATVFDLSQTGHSRWAFGIVKHIIEFTVLNFCPQGIFYMLLNLLMLV